MNGADLLCDTLLANEIDVCFANPGTSEMHFVAALDRKPQMKCVLGLFEGVVSGAADGYGRMADKPAATLLHLGPGLANALANLHNARRARTPVLNVVGDHATYHLPYDAPLTSDIESLARPMSHWVGRGTSAQGIQSVTEEAYLASLKHRGVSTLILPADVAWTEVAETRPAPVTVPSRPVAGDDTVLETVRALRSRRRVALILSGKALRADALRTASQIAAATGASVFSQTSDRTERGAGRAAARPIPYSIDQAVNVLSDIEIAICLGNGQPVAFFAYPGKPSTALSSNCERIQLATHEDDIAASLAKLRDALGLTKRSIWTENKLIQSEITDSTGVLNAESIAIAVARRMPTNAIVCEESITSGGKLAALAPGLHPHDHLPLTGGAIGEGIPLAIGAAVASPDRKIICLQADGSGMYTVQGLWTQARENLNVLTIVYANRAYAILQNEMRNVGVNDFGVNARRMLDLDNPFIDWCKLAEGMGVEAGRATSTTEFNKLLEAGLRKDGPFLIEAVI